MRLIYRFSAELFSLCHRYDPCQTMDRMHATRRLSCRRVFCFRHSSASLAGAIRRRQLITACKNRALPVCLSVCHTWFSSDDE